MPAGSLWSTSTLSAVETGPRESQSRDNPPTLVSSEQCNLAGSEPESPRPRISEDEARSELESAIRNNTVLDSTLHQVLIEAGIPVQNSRSTNAQIVLKVIEAYQKLDASEVSQNEDDKRQASIEKVESSKLFI